MENYEIKNNDQFNSREVYFSGKPDEAIRTALKDLKMRWNHVKACWYGYATQFDIINAITTATDKTPEPTTGIVVSEGYMGAVRVDGVNSNKFLYGADLSAAVRSHLKAANIGGCSVSVKTYSGGQSLTVKVRISEDDVSSVDEYAKTLQIRYGSWYYPTDDGKAVLGETYFQMGEKQQEEFRRAIAQKEITSRLTTSNDINHFHLDEYKQFKPAFLKKLQKINEVITSYRYDDSNSMVDYFETNFYYHIETVPAK